VANVSVFDVSGGAVSAAPSISVAAAAALQTVPPGKDSRMALRVGNGNATEDVAVNLVAGDGPRAVLGDKVVTVSAGQTAYIALFDTARFKRFSDGAVAVKLTASSGAALTAQELALVAIEAIQL
jgi:hypothetical protein